MAIDTKKLFNEELPAALAAHPDEAKAIGAKYQINVTGSGEWFIDVSDSGPSCKAGAEGTADCTITMSDEDFQKLHENPQANGMQLYMAGKLKVGGNPMLAMKLQKLFALKALPRPRTPPLSRSREGSRPVKESARRRRCDRSKDSACSTSRA